MRREYARAPRGQRVTGTRPFRLWKTISLVGAIRLGEKPKLMTSRSTINGPAFLRFVTQSAEMSAPFAIRDSRFAIRELRFAIRD